MTEPKKPSQKFVWPTWFDFLSPDERAKYEEQLETKLPLSDETYYLHELKQQPIIRKELNNEIGRFGKFFIKPKDLSHRGFDFVKTRCYGEKGFKKYKLTEKEFKPRKWVRSTFVRPDGMVIERWKSDVKDDEKKDVVEEDDDKEDVKNNFNVKKGIYGTRSFNDEAAELSTLTEEENAIINRGKYIWSYEETMYLIDMCKKYKMNYFIISDRYYFNNRQRPVVEIKARIHWIKNCLQVIRKQPNTNELPYSAAADKYNRAALKTYLNMHPKEMKRLKRVHRKVHKFPMFLYQEKERIDAADAAAAVAAEQAVSVIASVGAGLASSTRSSCSRPPSRLSSVTRAVPRHNPEIITDWEKKIEFALDTSVLRFFNNQAIGSHMQSQEYRLLSNVNVKKKANIDYVVDVMEAQVGVTFTTFTKEISDYYVRLSVSVNQVAELRNVYNNAFAEMIALNNELKEKTGQEESLADITPMTKTYANGQPSVLSHIESPNNPIATAVRRR